MKYSQIASRSLFHSSRRYILLFIAASIGIALTITCSGIMNGMMKSLHDKAKIYYGGDATILGHDFFDFNEFEKNHADFFSAENYILCPRIDYENDSYFIFEGKSVKQRKLKGIDFSKEGKYLKNLTFVQGSFENIDNSNGVLISDSLAKVLNVNAGDEIMLLLKTLNGYTNTANVIVKGIFKDSSIFGNNISYFDIDFLRNVAEINENHVIYISIYENEAISTVGIDRFEFKNLQNKLSKFLDLAPLLDSKKEFLKNNPHDFGLISLDANLQEIAFLIKAMHIIIYIIMTILVIIIAIGIGSTYKVIAVKRINEIGMYMALGLNSKGIIAIFVLESYYLITGAFAASILLTIAFGLILGNVDFSIIPNFDIFLTNGHILVLPTLWQIILIYVIVCVTTITLVCFTVRKYANVAPVKALAVTE